MQKNKTINFIKIKEEIKKIRTAVLGTKEKTN
jgi:hypothetical protein